MKRTGELKTLSPRLVTKDSMRWYIYVNLIPGLTKWWKDDELGYTNSTHLEWCKNFIYEGTTDAKGKPAGWG